MAEQSRSSGFCRKFSRLRKIFRVNRPGGRFQPLFSRDDQPGDGTEKAGPIQVRTTGPRPGSRPKAPKTADGGAWTKAPGPNRGAGPPLRAPETGEKRCLKMPKDAIYAR